MQCGTLESEEVELLTGNLSVSAAFVAQHERPVGRLRTQGTLCSGTLISSDLFLTNAHCISGGIVNAVVEFNYQRRPDLTEEPVSTYNVLQIVEQLSANPNVAWQQDYAILRLEGSPGNTWGMASIAETGLGVGANIVVIGHPEGGFKQVAPGFVQSITGFYLDVVVDVGFGSSGSGVLDVNGQLNGVFFRGGCDTGGPFNGALSMANLLILSPTLSSLKGPPPPPPPSLPINATFATNAEGFTYADNAFRGANNPNFASGVLSNGKLQVSVGGGTFTNASGGWSKNFSTTAAGPVSVSFKYSITSDPGIDPGEWVEALVSIDGRLYGAGTTDYVRRIEDGGNQAEVTFSFTSVSLGAGQHTITLGAAMNSASAATETGTITIDDVSVTAGASCTPNCTGKQCGSDGCGGSCGTCGAGLTCNASQQCVTACTPNCNGKQCGSDGCGGSCGTCGTGLTCNASQQCVTACTPSCAGKQCGSDGCGGSCGTCGAGLTCNAASQCIAGSTTYINASFASNAEGFTYADNAFRGANNPNFANGVYSNGKLQVTVGGGTFTNASGGWSKSFTTSAAGPVNVSFKYSITSDLGIDPGEWVETLVSIDGALYGAGGKDYVRRIEDGGNQAEVTFSFTSVSLPAGTHTIKLGAAMNAATATNEVGTITIDDVIVTAGAACTPSCSGKQCGSDGCGGSCGACGVGLSCNAAQQCVATCTPSCSGKQCGSDGCGGSCGACGVGLSCNAAQQCVSGSTTYINASFASNAEGFTYADNALRGANQPNFASGVFSNGKLQVTVGGGTFTNTSGGWSLAFTTTAAGPLSVSFKYSINSALGIDPGEWVETLVSIDGTLYGAGGTDYVRRIEDGGNQAEVTFSFTSASLAPGNHTITLGAAMNKATATDEVGTITIDDVLVKSQ